MPGAKHWCITWNNYDDPCLGFDEDTMQYMICGLEVGMSGTPHIQGYVQFKERKTLKQLKNIWPNQHMEIAKGTPSANQTYCSKDGQSHEHGKCIKGQGARNDLLAIKELIDNGEHHRVREQYYADYIRYQKALKADIQHVTRDREELTELHIHWGTTGTGKSRFCFENYPGAYWKSKGEWWDGYEQQETVVIDEFYGWLPVDLMLRLIDRYPMQVPYKGGYTKFTSKRVIITANTSWQEWWRCLDDRLRAAFERRITSIKEYTTADLDN